MQACDIWSFLSLAMAGVWGIAPCKDQSLILAGYLSLLICKCPIIIGHLKWYLAKVVFKLLSLHISDHLWKLNISETSVITILMDPYQTWNFLMISQQCKNTWFFTGSVLIYFGFSFGLFSYSVLIKWTTAYVEIEQRSVKESAYWNYTSQLFGTS